MKPAAPAMSTTLLQAEGLGFAYPGHCLFSDLTFAIRPGLTLVRGGDGRGKTTLLRLLAGTLAPGAGVIHRQATGVFHDQAADRAHDATVARDWLAAWVPRHAAWDDRLAGELTAAFGLAGHIDKPLYMLSTGSRRKLGLVAAAASGAALTLLDTPYAALDAPSGRVLTRLLAEAAAGQRRAWVLADGELPAGLASLPVLPVLPLAGLVDLGD
jgi:ABC-type transport system involved in cytochrome c biogenesis ATPase subunit